MTATSAARVSAFVDWFIRSDWVSAEWSDVGSDRFITDPDRAARCEDAAENGSDGSTHREHIDDWRQAFSRFLRSRKNGMGYDRFEAAVRADFDRVENWHTTNGSIDQEIG